MKSPRLLPLLATALLALGAGIRAASAAENTAATPAAGSALIRHAPVLSGTIEGSVHQMLGESVSLNGGAAISGDLRVPGQPALRLNGNPKLGATFDGNGSALPANYQITLNGNSALGRLVRRTDPVPLPTIAASPAPTGSRRVAINGSAETVTDFASLLHLTLDASGAPLAVPPGSYGEFTINGSRGLLLGIPGATRPAHYYFQRLTLNGTAELQLSGPVSITVAGEVIVGGSAGASAQPEWLRLDIAGSGLTLSGSGRLYGQVRAPNGTVAIHGNSRLIGGVVADRLIVGGNGLLRLLEPPNQAPEVVLTAPPGGASYIAPATLLLQATAVDPDGSVDRVEFFGNGSKLGEAVKAPYQLAVADLAAGTHAFFARAWDNRGVSKDSATVTISVVGNRAPSVTITSPVDGAVFTAPATFAVTATASDPDGTVARVEFWRDGSRIGEDVAAPFEGSVVGLPAGTYVLRARAIDNLGKSTDSSPSTVVVALPNRPPVVALTSPAGGTVLVAPASFTLVASATDADGEISRVEFFHAAAKVGEDRAAPFEWSLSGLADGRHVFYARAVDDRGGSAESDPVAVVVTAPNQPPAVILNAPADGMVFTVPATIQLSAAASDPDGTIAKVGFYQGTSLLGEITMPPFQLLWSNVPPGAYTLTARAHDEAGASTTSLPRSILLRIGLPYFTGFESADGYSLGPLAGQAGWSATGDAAIAGAPVFQGTRSLAVGGGALRAQAAHVFPPQLPDGIAFVDFFARPVAGAAPVDAGVARVDSTAQVAFVRADGLLGEIFVLNGAAAGAASWQPTGVKVPISAEGRATDWLRLTLRADFATKRWDLSIGGKLEVFELGFGEPVANGMTQLTLQGPPDAASAFDDFFVGFDHPLFADADRDGMPDAWERENGLNPALNDRAADRDGDGLANIREFQIGTRADQGDTDGDGLPDEWEFRHGLDPRRAAGMADDADGDGLSDRQEFSAGTNPKVADTDGDGLPDGWEVNRGLDPKRSGDAAEDSDGDGRTALEEYRAGTDPHDYYDGVLPNLVSLLAANQQPGANGLIAVLVSRASGAPLPNAPLTWEAGAGGLTLSPTADGPGVTSTLGVRADAQGIARVYVRFPIPAAETNTVLAKAISGGQTAVLSIAIAPPFVDADGDGLPDAWETRYLGGLGYSAVDDPGGIGRTLAQTYAQNLAPWPPATVGARLQLWFRADLGLTKNSSDKVNFWADLSGGGGHLAQDTSAAQPLAVVNVAGGRTAVRFGGAHRLRSPSLVDLVKGSHDLTVLAVVRPGSSQATYADIIDYDHTTPTYGGFVLQQNENALNQFGLGWRYNGAWQGLAATASLAANSAQLIAIVKGGTSQAGFVNGEQKFAVTVPAELQAGAPRFVGVGGVGAATGDRFFNGDIAEILVYNTALSVAERRQVESALISRYALLPPPVAPVNLAATAVSPTQVRLSWSAALPADGVVFMIERQVGSGAFTLLAEVVNALTYVDPTIVAGQQYTYRVRVRGFTGLSAYDASTPYPPLTDSDGDGVSDALEIAANTNPADFYNGRAFAILFPTAGSIAYAYDGAGRLTRATYGGGLTSFFGYDATSNLLSASTSAGAASPIAAWRQLHGLAPDGTGTGADNAILAGDGLPNLAKYAFGFVPQTAIAIDQPVVSVTGIGAARYLALKYRRPESAPADVVYRVQVSADGESWISGAGTVFVAATVTDGIAELTFRDATAVGTPVYGRRIRLLVERILQP